MKLGKAVYPDTKCAIGPEIAQGFYYDFDFSFAFGDEHLGLVHRNEKSAIRFAKPGLTRCHI